MILKNVSSPSPDRKPPSKMQNDVLRTRPSAQLAFQPYSSYLRCFEFPWSVHERVNSIRTSNTNRNSTQSTSIWRMAIRTEHHQSRRCIVLQDSLMYNSRTRGPELNAILLRRRLEKVIHLLIALY